MRKPRRSRKARNERQTLDIIFRQAKLFCPECGAELRREAIERDHMTPLALGGEDEPENEWYLCEECHCFKTNGNGATSAGSDKHKIAKARRIAKANAIQAGEIPAPRKAAIPGRPFPAATHEQILARRAVSKLCYKRARSAELQRKQLTNGAG